MTLGYPAVSMYELKQTAGFEPQLIVSHERRQETIATSRGGVPSLRGVPVLPLRVGRHLTAWVVWHTARVSLLADAPHGELNGSADRSL
jgi:hypothetical protein